jgi:hypothetical protein
MKLVRLFIGILLCGFCSCIVTAPRYTTVDKVFDLKIGMTKDEVTKTLGTTPYMLKAVADSQSTYLYKYRVTDRTTVPFFMNGTNGKSVLGKYVNLLVTFNHVGLVVKLESCGSGCDETIVQTNKIDFNKIVTFITVTVPLALVFLGVVFSWK